MNNNSRVNQDRLYHAAVPISNLSGLKSQRAYTHHSHSETQDDRAATVLNFCHFDQAKALWVWHEHLNALAQK